MSPFVTRLFLAFALLLTSLAACDSRRAEPSGPAAPASAPVSQPIVVDVYTDLVCPWCFIGTERLDRVIAASELGPRVVVRHHAFLLNPDTPAEGIDVAAYLRAKTGREPAEMFGRVEAVARASGIALDLSRQPRLYSTIGAHALLRRAGERGAQRALERALFRAYFLDGTDLTNLSALISIAAQHGFSEDEARRIAEDPSELAAVREETQQGAARGVRGVPFFVFPGGRTLSGAQSEETLRAALAEAAREATP